MNHAGLVDWKTIQPAIQLVVDWAAIKPTDKILLFGCHQGALPAYLAVRFPDSQLAITDHNHTALETTSHTLAANGISPDCVRIISEPDLSVDCNQCFETVILLIPNSRVLVRRWLLQAYQALIDGGNLFLAGSNKGGIQSVLKDATELFATWQLLAYKKGNRIAQFTGKKPADVLPGWSSSPGISPGSWVQFPVEVAGRTISIRSLPGVFSFDQLDHGTHMLLDTLSIQPGAKVLDAGCGYGIIGIAAAVLGAGRVNMIDNNLLAIAACRETIRLNQIENTSVQAGDLMDPLAWEQYDLVLSNPPFHTGQAVDYQIAQTMIEHAHQALVRGGKLIIVANRFIRYDRLIEKIYGSCTVLKDSNTFHVLCGLKS